MWQKGPSPSGGGAFLAARRFQNKDPPFGVTIAHGLAAAAGLITLLVTVMGARSPGSASLRTGIG